MKVLASLPPWSRRIDFLLVEERPEGRHSIGKNIIMETAESGLYSEPTFSLAYEDAQALMDSLWTCGLRPTEGTGSAGALAAIQAHLKDLQRIVFERGPSANPGEVG